MCARSLSLPSLTRAAGKSDPFVEVRYSSKSAKTPVVDSNLNPVWNHQIQLCEPALASAWSNIDDSNIVPGENLHCIVWNYNKMTENDFLVRSEGLVLG